MDQKLIPRVGATLGVRCGNWTPLENSLVRALYGVGMRLEMLEMQYHLPRAAPLQDLIQPNAFAPAPLLARGLRRGLGARDRASALPD